MARKPFKQYVKDQLFNHLDNVLNKDSSIWRIDRKGRKISKEEHGNRSSEYGWNIHHKDGNKFNNDLSNLEALNYVSHDEEHND